MSGAKQKAAFSSVLAAVFLTVVKISVGVFTGSLGVLSEAAHSALDLVAAVVTFFAVKISDKPADKEHNYGHGKVESFSALIETLLLLATCGWIIYEAVERLFLGKAAAVSGTIWGILVMILSIIINISRSRVLKKVAKEHGSQALEADALHFDSDIWSSLVVIGGLACVGIGEKLDIPFMHYADPVAALGVSLLVIVVSIQLGKRTIDVLLDTAPEGMINNIMVEVNKTDGVLEVSSVRVRPSGPRYFIDLSVGIGKNESHRVVHSIVHEIRDKLHLLYPDSDVTISTFPVEVDGTGDKEAFHTIKKIVDRFPVCTNIHNINIYEVSGKKRIAIHLEVKEAMSLKVSHELSHTIEDMIQEALVDVEDVSVNFEYAGQNHIMAEDITSESADMICTIESLINKVPEKLNCHDIKVYRQKDAATIFLHCEVSGDYTVDKIEKISKSISNKIKRNIDNIDGIHVHVEPMAHA